MKVFSAKELTNQFAKFGFVGILNNAVFMLCYYILIHFGVQYLISNTVAYAISIFNAYYFNGKFVFKSSKSGINAILKTYLSYGVTLIISTLSLYVMVNHMGISAYLAPIVNLMITIPINFILNKYWTFK